MAAHGSPTLRSPALWINRHTLAIPYPHVIRFDTSKDDAADYSEIEAFIESRPQGAPTAVNDSFSSLDLSKFGLKRLFSSPWSFRQPGEVESKTLIDLEIESVESPEQLREFDLACSTGFGSPDSPRVHLEPLLSDTRYRTHIGRSNGRVVTGAMAFTNGESVGIYSLFTLPEARNRGFGEAIVRSVLAESATLPATTNPSDMSDGLFSRLGFMAVGQRTIWITAS